MSLDGARLFHVNVNCRDLARSRAFYVEALGLSPGVETTNPTAQPGDAFGLASARWDAWILLGERGFEGGAIDLLEWQEPRPTGAAPGSLTECGYQRVGLGVRDLDTAMAGVRRGGGTVWSEPMLHQVPGGAPIRIVMAGDPDGTAIELYEGARTGPSFVAVVCADVGRSSAWYGALGFREIARFPSERGDGAPFRVPGPMVMEEVVLRPPGGGDMTVLLVGFRTPAATAATPRPANTVGIWRAAYLVPDAHAAYASVTALGIDPLSPPVAMAMGEGLPDLRFFCFAGPDGEILECIEDPTG